MRLKKMILKIIRYISIILTFICAVASGFGLFGIQTPTVLICFPISIILLVISYKYDYCYLHRMSLYYIIGLGILHIIPSSELAILYTNVMGMSVGTVLVPMIIYHYNLLRSYKKQIKYIKELFKDKVIAYYVKTNKDNFTEIYRRH